MQTRTLTIIFIGLLLIMGGGAGYWYFFLNGNNVPASTTTSSTKNQNDVGFKPFGDITTPVGTTSPNTSNNGDQFSSGNTSSTTSPIAALRLLSNDPVGGFGASTTASSTIVRWVDRGRGNIFETNTNNTEVLTISNTVVPMIYSSIWGKNLTSFIGSIYNKDSATMSAVYAEITKRTAASSTQSSDSFTNFQLKGKNLPPNTVGFAVSPKKDKVFILVNEDGKGVGYVSTFDGKTVTKIFDTPLTQLNVEWPSENIIALTTKGSANSDSYLYFVDPKTGTWKKIYGPAKGLSAEVSHDAKRVFISSTKGSSLMSSIITLADSSVSDAVVRTLADKCVWGNFDKQMIYCATPSKIPSAIYPDDWYTGSISFADKIWQLNTESGEVHLVSQITDASDRVIDAFNLGLDDKDNFLFFMNKNDLSLWSLDLVSL